MVPDEALYERLIGGDLTALDALYDRYGHPLFGYILRQIGDRHEAEDTLHDVFLSILKESRAGCRAPECFRAWIWGRGAECVPESGSVAQAGGARDGGLGSRGEGRVGPD